MFIRDLTLIAESDENIDPFIVAAYPQARMVGWLDVSEPFPQGLLSVERKHRLWEHRCNPFSLSMGQHLCKLCYPELPSLTEYRQIQQENSEGPESVFGNGDILIVGSNGEAFITPVLICHYVVHHGYLPPEPFLEALDVSDSQLGVNLSRQTWKRLGPVGLEWWDNSVVERRLRLQPLWKDQ